MNLSKQGSKLHPSFKPRWIHHHYIVSIIGDNPNAIHLIDCNHRGVMWRESCILIDY